VPFRCQAPLQSRDWPAGRRYRATGLKQFIPGDSVGTTLVIANSAGARVRAATDLLVELSLEVPELARLAAYMFPMQLLSLYTGLSKGLDPDSPRNLSPVFILDKKDSSQEPEHAAL